jgi:hypothetical protein
MTQAGTPRRGHAWHDPVQTGRKKDERGGAYLVSTARAAVRVMTAAMARDATDSTVAEEVSGACRRGRSREKPSPLLFLHHTPPSAILASGSDHVGPIPSPLTHPAHLRAIYPNPRPPDPRLPPTDDGPSVHPSSSSARGSTGIEPGLCQVECRRVAYALVQRGSNCPALDGGAAAQGRSVGRQLYRRRGLDQE